MIGALNDNDVLLFYFLFMQLIKNWLDSSYISYTQILDGTIDNLEVISFFHQGAMVLVEHSITDPDFYNITLPNVGKVTPSSDMEKILGVINTINSEWKLVKVVYDKTKSMVDINAEVFFIKDLTDVYYSKKVYAKMDRILSMLHRAHFKYTMYSKI